MNTFDIICIGGGLAGLTAAIDLSARGHSVLVIEKKNFPHHKVCGEYISKEVLPYLDSLQISFEALTIPKIDTLVLSTVDGKLMQTKLPLGGIGISRYTLDHILYKKAMALGVAFCFETASEISYVDSNFEVRTENESSFAASIVIGAYGKRSNLDKHLGRGFMQKKSSWLAVKSHYEYRDLPSNQVALHNFMGGYAGLSKIETGAVNFCYLVNYESFKKTKNIEEFNAKVLSKNSYLKNFLSKAKPIFETPLSIAQISFEPKTAVDNHVLMCGDAAGLIHPLCGNGMAMAIHSAKIASEGINDYLIGRLANRDVLERCYQNNWNRIFKKRMWNGRQLQALLLNERLSAFAMKTIIRSPRIMRSVIKSTHGKELVC